jgi:hypothetical protein
MVIHIYKKKTFFMNPRILHNTRSINDRKYIILDTQDNARINKFQTDNFRTTKYTKNPKYYYLPNHQIYYLQSISEGQGAGMNADLDSSLTRGDVINLPDDRLTEKVTYIRHVDILPPKITYSKTYEFDHNKFLVSTTISDDPQREFNPEFHMGGVNTTNYIRPSDEYWRNYAKKSNKYRFPSKYYKYDKP